MNQHSCVTYIFKYMNPYRKCDTRIHALVVTQRIRRGQFQRGIFGTLILFVHGKKDFETCKLHVKIYTQIAQYIL